MTAIFTTETRCKRCETDRGTFIQCNECRAFDQRNAFCWCGHTRFLHHHGLGCLATMAGDPCPCNIFELRIHPLSEMEIG